MAITEQSIRTTGIEGLVVLAPKAATDERGVVREFFRKSAFDTPATASFGPPLQVNLTFTGQGAIRGLHGEEMTKLVGVVAGSGFGAYVDVRPASASFGAVETVELDPCTQILVPSGVCNGFQCSSAGGCAYLYCFDAEWAPGMAGTAVHPLDTDLAISWPIPIDPGDRRLLSAKDAALPSFADLRERLGRPGTAEGSVSSPAPGRLPAAEVVK